PVKELGVEVKLEGNQCNQSPLFSRTYFSTSSRSYDIAFSCQAKHVIPFNRCPGAADSPEPCTKASHVAHMNAADSTPRSSLPSCSYCLDVIWQTKRLFIQSRNKTQHPPFTLRLAENFSPQIKEGIIANMAEIPNLIPIL
ncbi:putative hemin import ATP-binding protein HrtA, partial [Dissostichus eleginoides]